MCMHLCHCIHIYICVCVCAFMWLRVSVCMHLCGYMWLFHVCMYAVVWLHVVWVYMHYYGCLHACLCICVPQHACRCGRICVVACMYILRICECTNVAAYMCCLTMTESFLSKMSCAENTDVRRINIHKAQTCMKKKMFYY